MSNSTPSWDLFESFLAVMRDGSLSGASRSLHTAQPTIRRRIETLEAQLGVALFTRSPSGLLPTDAARRTLPYAESIAAMVNASVRASSAAADANHGIVRLTCSEMMGAELLPQILAPLLTRHPGLQIELVATNANEDLLRRDADIAVRLARPTQTGLVARKIGVIAVGLFGSTALLNDRPKPTCVADITNCPLVGGDASDALLQGLKALSPASDFVFQFRSDSDLVQLAAVRAGIGIGVCQVPLAARTDDLVRVLPDLDFGLEAWLVMHEDLRTTARVRLVFAFLAETLADYISGKA